MHQGELLYKGIYQIYVKLLWDSEINEIKGFSEIFPMNHDVCMDLFLLVPHPYIALWAKIAI